MRLREEHRLQVGRLDLQQGDVVPCVLADNAGLVAVLVPGLNFDVLRVGDDVVVGRDMALPVEDEARPLTLARNRAVEEVHLHGRRSHVDNRRQQPLVDADIGELLGVVLRRGFYLFKNERGFRPCFGGGSGREGGHESAASGEVPDSADEGGGQSETADHSKFLQLSGLLTLV